MYDNAAKKEEQSPAQEELGKLGPEEEVKKPETPPEKGEEEEEELGFDYSTFSDEFDNDETDEDLAERKPPEEPPQEEKPEEPSQEKPKEEETPEETPEKKEEEEAKEEEEKKEEEPEKDETVYDPDQAKPPETLEEYNKRLEAARGSAEKELQERYKLSEEEADEFLSDPQSAVPKALSKVYLDVYQQVLGDIKAMVPNMVQQVQTQAEQRNKVKEEFFGIFPGLRDVEDQVDRVAHMYVQQAQQNGEKLTRNELFKRVGVQVSITNSKPIPPEILNGAGETAVPTNKEEEAPKRDKPWAPSNPGQPSAPTGAGRTAGQPNIFERLAVEEETDWDN